MTLDRRAARAIDVGALNARLIAHPLYARINDDVSLRHFMASHVFCVWDFQSLLKALQRQLTCVTVPWVPSAHNEARRFINEIVLDEESDGLPDGGYASHFELYVSAMAECGADTQPVERFVDALRGGRAVDAALDIASAPPGAARFVRHTMDLIARGPLHCIAAAFTYGREDVIPDMFARLVHQLAVRAPHRWSKFLYYLDRHIEADGEKHGPLAHRLIADLCGADARRWEEAGTAARAALESRLRLWDDVLESMPSF